MKTNLEKCLSDEEEAITQSLPKLVSTEIFNNRPKNTNCIPGHCW